MPMMAFIGVRISWLMLARNSDFAAVASSAFCLASRISFSCCFRTVTSRTETATCGSSESRLGRGLNPISAGNIEPSLRTPRN